MKRGIIFFVLLAVSLLFVFSAAAEKKDHRVYFGPEGALMQNGIPADAVAVQRVHYKYYLFLPGNIRTNDLKIWFDGKNNTVTMDGKVVRSGDSAAGLRAGDTIEIRVNTTIMKVVICRGSAIPGMFISTASGSMSKVDSTKRYKETGCLVLRDGTGEIKYDGDLSHVKLRGNTSAQFSKKGYQIKLTMGTDLLGMGKAKKWILTSNSRDHSLLRNQAVFAMSEYIGMPWTPECRQVELYLNHEYNGLYILQEKVEIGKNRVNIADLEKATESVNGVNLAELENLGKKKANNGAFKYVDIPNDPADITGGYLLEYENWKARYRDERCAYTTNRGKVILVKEPENASRAQMVYISEFMQGFENAIMAEDGRDPDTGKAYYEFVDLESLVLKYMLEEVSKNLDANASSQFFYKPPDSVSTVAFAGPAWDYDSCLGDFASRQSQAALLDPSGYWVKRENSGAWWPNICRHEEFCGMVCRMWQERFSDAVDVLLGKKEDAEGRIRSLDQYREEIRASAEMNFLRWPIGETKQNLAECGNTFDENVDYLKAFLENRQEFLESEWGTGIR